MSDAAELQDLLASLDATTQQLADFQQDFESSTNGDTSQTFATENGTNNEQLSNPGASNASIRKIDDLLGSLNAKQQEWEQKVLANSSNTSYGVANASLPRGATYGSQGPEKTTLLGSIAYPVNHRGSIVGAPVGTVRNEVKTAAEREKLATERILDMQQKWQRTKQQHTRWVRRGSSGVRLTEKEVSDLIDQGADAEEFEGVAEETSAAGTKPLSIKLTTAASPSVLNELDTMIQQQGASPAPAASPAASAPVVPTNQSPTPSTPAVTDLHLDDALSQFDELIEKKLSAPIVPVAKPVSPSPEPAPAAPTSSVVALQQKFQQEQGNSPIGSRSSSPALTRPASPGRVQPPLLERPIASVEPAISPARTQSPAPFNSQPSSSPATTTVAAPTPTKPSSPPSTPSNTTEPQRVHSARRAGPLPQRSPQAATPEATQQPPAEAPASPASPILDQLDDGTLDDILGMLDGVRFSTKLPQPSSSAASSGSQSPRSETPTRTSGILIKDRSGSGKEMRVSTKVMAIPLKTAARVQTATTRVIVPSESTKPTTESTSPTSVSLESTSPPPNAASFAPPAAQSPPTNNMNSPLAASILRAAAEQKAQFDDSSAAEDLWVFNENVQLRERRGALIQSALSQRRNSFNFAHELVLPKISIQVVVPHLYRTFDVSIDPGQSLASLKLFLWVEVFQTQNVVVGGHLTDYLFRAGEDDYFLDEKVLVRDTPFFAFCSERKFCPTVYFVQRNELDKLNKTIETIMEATLLMNDEAGQFRKEMHRILCAVMFKHYRRLPFMSVFEPSPIEVASNVWPQAYPAQIFVPEDNNPSSGRPPEKRTVVVPFRGTAKRVISSAQSDYPYLFEFKSEAASDYVIKIRGYNEYFVGDMELIASEYIRDCIRKRKRIDLVIVERDHLQLDASALVSHYTEILQKGRKAMSLVDINTLLSRETHPPNLRYSSLSLDRPLRIVVRSLEPIPFDQKLFNAPKKRTDLIQLYVSVEVRHVGATIGVVMRSAKQFYYEDAKEPVKFDSLLDMPSYCVLPRASVLHFEVHSLYRDKDTVLGWTEYQLFDSRGVISPGSFTSGLWLLAGEGSAAQQPVSGSSLLEHSSGPQLAFGIEDLGKPVVFPEFNYAEWKAENPTPPAEEVPTGPVLTKLNQIISKDALQVLEKEEKALLWQHRNWCKSQPAAAAKLLQSVPWVRPGAARELYRLLHEWTPLPPMSAIELLNKNFVDPEIRAFAVRNLHRLSDDELADILLQLVQALKHELDHDSFLARFLIIRAIYNPFKLGNYFFWYLKASMLQKAYRERFEVVLEVYLRYCGSFRQNLAAQLTLFRKIHAAAVELKTLKENRRKQFLDDKLEHIGLDSPFQIPISCNLLAKGFRIEKCKNLDSKTLPLWLVCENVDNLGDPLTFIMKAGDDLRQDQLTVQMFRIMDRLWLAAGLDLKMSPYVVLDAGAETGMIEVVGHAATNAAIQKDYGGVKAAFSEKPLLEWLKKHNLNETDLKNSVRDFMRSCAGYCVATYVLGIGDRHNDNIMCTKSGLLFHIDFGRFLGNSEKFAGVSRDRAPFVFTPEFLYVMGGTGNPLYKQFVEICCKAYNVLRANANIFINLFAMMLSTGIPELRSEADINYLRDAFSLDLTDEEAAKKFESLISESLKSKATQFNFAIHIMAHPEKDG